MSAYVAGPDTDTILNKQMISAATYIPSFTQFNFVSAKKPAVVIFLVAS